MPMTNTRHQTHTWLPKGADGPGLRGAMGRSCCGGASGPLVGSAGVGLGAGMRGEESCRLPLGSTITTTTILVKTALDSALTMEVLLRRRSFVWCNTEVVTLSQPLHLRVQLGGSRSLRKRLTLIYCIFIACLVLSHDPLNRG